MSESSIQLPIDGSGKKVRTLVQNIKGDEVHSDIIAIQDANGTLINPAKEDGNLANLDVALSTRLKPGDLNINPSEKLLGVAIADAVARILLNSAMIKLQTDVAGRLLVRIDVAGATQPISGAVTLASTIVSSLTKIADLPYTGYDHEKILAETAFQGIRGRMAFT
jgi:hypothetical protein